MRINYIHEPTDLQCGQAVLAMILDTTPKEICDLLSNERETTLAEMKRVLIDAGYSVSANRIQVHKKSELPELCMLSLETPRCWHWSLYYDGVFYDPEHGIMDDFPVSKRRFYWKIQKKESE